MPFKFHLKKSRQYNVVSKNQYVICVELLDSTSVECTLNIDSIGQECLTNVTQRLGLLQSEFFGLCYVCRHGTPSPKWIDVDKPLKRQLEKDAKNFNLYLRVMFYITDVQFINDEMTRFVLSCKFILLLIYKKKKKFYYNFNLYRYHYYLQLKSDILEDRVHCNSRQATVLASYSMQAEFGNYDAERHRTEFLQQYTFFPKVYIHKPFYIIILLKKNIYFFIMYTQSVVEVEPGGREALLNSSLCQYKMISGITQAAAEEYYITMVMQLEGYGHETFTAKVYYISLN